MKTLKSILCAAIAAITLASCGESTSEQHTTAFLPVNGRGIETYADQTTDSIRVISTDTWTLTNNTDWMDVKVTALNQTNNMNVAIQPGYFVSTRLDFEIQPNTTGRTRSALLQVNSSFAKIGTVTNQLVQYPFLNISTPAPRTSDNGVTFNLDFIATTNEASTNIVFTVHSADATLTSSADWLTVSQANGFTPHATQRVTVTAARNATGAARTATLTLTSAGISSVINVTQPAAKS